jgi:PEGA domain/TPR repeat
MIVLALCLSLVVSADSKKKPAPAAPVPVVEDNKTKSIDAKKRGDAALDAGRIAEALEAYEEASRLAPEDAALLYNRARAHEKMGQYPESLALLEKFNTEASTELRAKVPKLQSLLAAVKQKTSRLLVSCAQNGAEVRFKDRVLGVTPLAPMMLSSEKGELSVTKEGFFPWAKMVELSGGGDASFDIPLASRSTQGLLKVDSPLAGAAVSIDGQAGGNVPFETTLTTGTYRVKLMKDGFEAQETSIVLGSGETKALSLVLDPIKPIYSRWYFWAGIGLAVAGGVATGVALTTERPPVEGTLGLERAGLQGR